MPWRQPDCWAAPWNLLLCSGSWLQHQMPLRRLLNAVSNPEAPAASALRDRWLEQVASGQALAGVAFAHLRRPGAPNPAATRIPGGWRLDGRLDWITSGDIADLVLLCLRCVDSAELADSQVLFVEDFSVWSEADAATVCRVSPVVFGCIRGAIADLHQVASSHNDTQALALAMRSAQAAVIAHAGGAMYCGCAAERRLREASFLLVQAQTADSRRASLDLLLHSSFHQQHGHQQRRQ